MRILALAAAGLCTLTSARAAAESGEEMRARGEQLAKDGRYTEAIDAFKAAERIEPRARHSCLIALAYIRRELWPQAEIFLEQCEKRATMADPVPEWVPTAKQQLDERLHTVNVAPVKITVAPTDVDVKLAVSSFAPDELFGPRTIHLPPGRHVIIATAPGYNDAQKTIEVTDRAQQDVTITLLPIEDAVKPVPVSALVSPPGKLPWLLIGLGGAIAVGGAVNHLVWANPLRDEVKAATDPDVYADKVSDFERARLITGLLYGVGGATVITGVILKLTVYRNKELPVQVSMEPRDGGGLFTVGWTR